MPVEPPVTSPPGLAEAYDALADGPVRPIAGGTDLMVALTGELGEPPARILDLWRLDELRGIAIDGDVISLGALTTYTEIRRSALCREHLPVLVEAAATIGAAQIQNRGTLGGNVANASPAGDTLPVLLAADATFVLGSGRGERTVEAGTVVLAAGGRCYAVAEQRGELSTNHPNATGEVTQLALELGAEARDLDALQYHPNGGAWPPNMQGYSIPETTRAYGAVLLNAEGEEFTDSLGPRDAVSQAIVDEVNAGRGVNTPDGRPAVYLDTTRIAEADAEISLPYMLRRYRGAGIDPLREKILTYPVLHYQNGGLVIDTNAETTLEGVYACGEIAGGTHGRNRMMGNSLLECVVFGRRAGRAAAEKVSV